MKELYPWHSEVWQRWMGLRARLPHAILLKGAQGTGKLDFALNLSQSLLCERPRSDGMACENCPSCHWFQQESHPDFRLLQPDALSESDEDEETASSGKKKPSRQISVDQVRALNSFANLSAHQGGRRVVLIHPAEAMNTNAANALLKTLEEPTPGMLIILVSHKPQQLLPTILSRCLILAMPIPTTVECANWLGQQGVKRPEVVLAQAGFAPLLAVQLSRESDEPDEHKLFLQEIRHPDIFDALALAEQFQKIEPAKLIHWLQQWCYDLICLKLTGFVRYNPDHIEIIKSVSIKISVLNLVHYQHELLIARREATHPLNQRLQLESLLMNYRLILQTTR